MRYYGLIWLSAFIYLASAGELEDHIANLPREPFADKNSAGINKQRKTIDAQYAGFGDKKPFQESQATNMEVEREQVNLELEKQRKNLLAGARSNYSSAKYDDKNRASGTLFGDSGGFANAGAHRGLMRNSDTSDAKTSNLVADGKHTLNTVAEGQQGKIADKMWANSSSSRMRFGVDPATMEKTGGEGALFYQNDKKNEDEIYVYEVEQRTDNDARAELTKESQGSSSNAFLPSLFGSKRDKSYKCRAQKVGESICFDENGNTIGKVVATDDGRVTTFNKQGVPIAKGKAVRVSDTQYRVDVNDGLMKASVDNIKEYDCTQEVAGHKASEKIKLKKPLTFEYADQKSSDGTVTYQWPDCFTIGGEVMLAPGVDPKRLASEWIVNILPIGKLRCMDSGTCGRECYYCDYCTSKKKFDILANNDYQNLCDAKGNGQYQTLKQTICPPPEDTDFALCSKFSKSLTETDYWNKKGDIDVQMRMWLRPPSTEDKEKEFFDKLNAPFIGRANRLAMQAEWALDNGIKTGSVQPTDAELKQWYVRKKSGTEELLLCRRSLIKYNIAGDKVDTSFLIEASSSASVKKLPSIFQEKPCKEIQELEQAQYDADKQTYEEQNSGGDSSGGAAGRILSGILSRTGLTGNKKK